ncbi:MAG: hypothetical protein AAF696_16290, partial [Bacteroidota bacterium]
MFIAILSILLSIFLVLYLYIHSGPQLPSETDRLIREVQSEKLPEFISGQTGRAMNGNVSIYYERMPSSKKTTGSILLVNGHSSSMLYWQPYFYQPFLDAGYDVIRYDNRGIGMSDWIPNWTKETAFSLEDMAEDGSTGSASNSGLASPGSSSEEKK